jgi:hypothetical protein
VGGLLEYLTHIGESFSACREKEVITRIHDKLKSAACMVPPCLEFKIGNVRVIEAAQCHERALKDLVLRKPIAFENLKIGAQRRQEQFDEFSTAKHLLWEAT